jgi:deoxyribonuclease-1-like protein
LSVRKLLFVVTLLGLLGFSGWSYIQHYGPDDLRNRVNGIFGQNAENEDANQLVSDYQPPVTRRGETIRIASFNIQFGVSKARKSHVMEVLARIVRNFDIVAVQEIRSKDQSLLPKFVDLINSTGRHYDYAIGPPLGRSTSKEQYAYIFDRASVEIDRHQLYTVDDPDDLLHREPYVGWFRVRGPPSKEEFTFTLVNIHTDPDETDTELDVLDDVLRVVRQDGRNEDDVIILGDLNVDNRHLGQLGKVPGIVWTVSDTPTNTRGNAQYDNIVFQGNATVEYSGRSGVFDFLREFDLSIEQALEVSDHMPVWAEFSIYEGGIPGRVAALETSPK